MPSPPASPQHLASIDALRGFAAVWVFAYHIWNYYFPYCNSQAFATSLRDDQGWFYYPTFFLFQYGYYGVTIFFVVSGFCIHWPQARKHHATGRDQLRLDAFFQRRFWRLYPAYFGSLIVASLCMGAMLLQDYKTRGWPLPLPENFYEEAFAVMSVFYCALFLFPFFPFAKSLNSVYWTLVFELQFYLVYPLLVWFMRRCGLWAVGVVLLTCEAMMLPKAGTPDNWQDNSIWFYFFLSRYFEWYLGVVAAEIVVKRQTGNHYRYWLPFALLFVYSAVCIFVPLLWPTRDLAVAGTTFFLLLSVLPDDATKPLSWWMRWFVWLGAFSYSLYLLHLPMLKLMVVVNHYLGEWFFGTEPSWLMLDSVPVVILVSWGFYQIFEKPFLRAKPATTAG